MGEYELNTQSIVVIGAGPAGLTAALELQAAGMTNVTVIEAGGQVGGISKTVSYQGNRIDIGGHRFFSKSDWVMDWWRDLMPVARPLDAGVARELRYQGRSGIAPESTADEQDENVMLVRGRLSRIYFNKQFFDYPLKLNFEAVRKLGFSKTILFGFSYVLAKVSPVRPEASLEDFFINRFGRRLYRQFFKEYTEKVWGVPCREISASWGAQRIKSLSILKAVAHSIRQVFGIKQVAQTSLIESFLYPKYGPGQMWELAARKFEAQGGRILMERRVDRVEIQNGTVKAVSFLDLQGNVDRMPCDHLLSTMPIKDLIAASADAWSADLREIAAGLSYRDFITVGLLYPREAIARDLKDNWIYIQEPGVNVGRVQVFNNWSPYLVADDSTLWLGLEFFCRDDDGLWSMDDESIKCMAHEEMVRIGLVEADGVKDAMVLRVPKAYPGYFGAAFERFDELRAAIDAVPNLFLIGRNGMHRYNNQDHSMLTAREAARQIAEGRVDKAAIWNINIDDEYHEER